MPTQIAARDARVRPLRSAGIEHVEIRLEDLFIDDEPTLVDLPVVAKPPRVRGKTWRGLGAALAVGMGVALLGVALGLRRR